VSALYWYLIGWSHALCFPLGWRLRTKAAEWNHRHKGGAL
jgi:hypothetical protein